MSKNTNLSVTLLVKGDAGKELKKITDQQVKDAQKINQQWTQIGTAQAKVVNTAKAGTQATISTARAGDQLLRTNRMLEGVLRQQSIQTKLQSQLLKQQENSAKHMASWMKQVEQSSQRTQKASKETSSLWQKGGAVAGGVAVGGAVISSALQKPRTYDEQLTRIAITATGGQGLSTENRLKKIGDLDNMIKTAVRSGGGTREDAAQAINTLIASGKYDLDTVAPALNIATKTAFSQGASANDAAILTGRMQDFGITNLQEGHDIAVKGSQLGGFEYKDQAKWLAQQMAAAKAIGYSGKQGLIHLVGMNQVAMSTAGSTDEGGNNVVNLLAKLSSREFSKSIGDNIKIQKGDPTKLEGKKKPHQVFDWEKYAINQREQGVYGVDAFMKLLERQLVGNKEYQALQKKAQNSKNSTEQKQAIEDMIGIAGGSEIGKIIADRQALMAAYAVSYQKDNLNKMTGQLQNSSGTVNDDIKVATAREWAKNQAIEQEKLFSQSKAYDVIAEPLAKVKAAIVDFAQKHDGLAAATYAATVALTALAGAGATAAVLNGGLSGGKGGVLQKAGGTVIRGGSAIATGTGVLVGSAAGQVTIAGALGYGVGTVSRNMYMTTEKGRQFDDWAGEKVAQIWATLGSQEAKDALDSQAKFDQMIAEQQNLATVMSSNFLMLAKTFKDNKTVFPSIPQTHFTGSLADNIANHAAQQEQRHGAPYALGK